MKSILSLCAMTLSSAVVLASSFVVPSSNAPARNFTNARQTVAPVQKVYNSVEVKPFATVKAVPVASDSKDLQKAPATTYGAYYGLGNGTFHYTLGWDSEYGIYTTGNATSSIDFVMAYPYKAKFNALLGDSWSYVTSRGAYDFNSYKDEQGDITIWDMGIGVYNLPTISNGDATYCCSDSCDYGYLLPGYYFQYATSLTKFNIYETDVLIARVNTGSGAGYAYGSSTAMGKSGSTIINYGQVGGPLVVENVQFLVYSSGTMFASSDDYIQVDLLDIQGNDTITYTSQVHAENIETVGYYKCATATFSAVDEDGFDVEVSPVVTGKLELRFSNTEGCDYGILMSSSSLENTDEDGYSIYPSCSYFYYGGDAMEQRYYSWQGADACVMLNAYYNAMCTYGVGTNETNVYVPADAQYATTDDGTEYTVAISEIVNDTAYYESYIESTLPIDYWTYDELPEGILSFQVDTTYYADYFVYMVYVIVGKLPEGQTGRSMDLVFHSNDEASYTIHVLQGDLAGIKAVKNDAKKEDEAPVYNLQGIRMNSSREGLKPGIYVSNGKKFIK